MVLLSPLKTTMTCFNLSIRNHIIIQTCNVELWCSRKSPMRPLTRPLRTRWKTSRIRNRNYNSSKKVGKKALQNRIEFCEIKSRARQFRIRRSSDITVFENSSKKSHYKIQGIFHGFYRYLFTYSYFFTKSGCFPNHKRDFFQWFSNTVVMLFFRARKMPFYAELKAPGKLGK